MWKQSYKNSSSVLIHINVIIAKHKLVNYMKCDQQFMQLIFSQLTTRSWRRFLVKSSVVLMRKKEKTERKITQGARKCMYRDDPGVERLPKHHPEATAGLCTVAMGFGGE